MSSRPWGPPKDTIRTESNIAEDDLLAAEAGIRTLGYSTLRSYNGLANRRLQPLGHLTGIARVSRQAGRTSKRITHFSGAGLAEP